MATALTSELTRFTDKCNNVLAGGIVKTFEPNSLTPKISYQDPECTIPNLHEVNLDETGRAKIYIQGDYRIQVYSRDGILIEDNLLVEQTLVQRDFDQLQQLVAQKMQEIQEALDNYQTDWPNITNKPTTVDGYGITDAYKKTEVDTNFIAATEKGAVSGIASLDTNSKIPVAQLPQATETAVGVAEIATQAETNAGTDNVRFVTPLKLLAAVKNHLNATGNAPLYALRTFINFDGSGSMTVRSSGNLSSISDNGTGDWTLNFAAALSNANYVPLLSMANGGNSGASIFVYSASNEGVAALKTTTQLRLLCKSGGNTADAREIYVGIV